MADKTGASPKRERTRTKVGKIKTYQISAKISFDLEPDEFEPQLESLGDRNSLPSTLESPIAE
jgi:hypothetical protein